MQGTKVYSEAKWQGSENTLELVRRQIFDRWGQEEAEKYDPKENCFTFNTWKAKGYNVKKGEKCLESYTYIKRQDPTIAAMAGEIDLHPAPSYPKKVCLFYYLQVEKSK